MQENMYFVALIKSVDKCYVLVGLNLEVLLWNKKKGLFTMNYRAIH